MGSRKCKKCGGHRVNYGNYCNKCRGVITGGGGGSGMIGSSKRRRRR